MVHIHVYKRQLPMSKNDIIWVWVVPHQDTKCPFCCILSKKVGETREYLSMQLNYSYIICTPFIKVFMVYSVDSNVRRQRKWLKWSIKHLNTYFTVSCVPYHSNMNRVCSYVTSSCACAYFVLWGRSQKQHLPGSEIRTQGCDILFFELDTHVQ